METIKRTIESKGNKGFESITHNDKEEIKKTALAFCRDYFDTLAIEGGLSHLRAHMDSLSENQKKWMKEIQIEHGITDESTQEYMDLIVCALTSTAVITLYDTGVWGMEYPDSIYKVEWEKVTSYTESENIHNIREQMYDLKDAYEKAKKDNSWKPFEEMHCERCGDDTGDDFKETEFSTCYLCHKPFCHSCAIIDASHDKSLLAIVANDYFPICPDCASDKEKRKIYTDMIKAQAQITAYDEKREAEFAEENN